MRTIDYWRSENKEITLSIDTSSNNQYCFHNGYGVTYVTAEDLKNLRTSIDFLLRTE